MSRLFITRRSRSIQITLSAVAVLLLLVGSTEKARADDADKGVRVDFPTSDALPYNKFGVFIGIDRYSKLPPENQLEGCVADANAMKETFVRLGVQRYALITNGQATRAGIGKVLSDLVEQVKLAKSKTQDPITVVITYAGHGCRLKRLATEEDPTDIDSSWVAADSDIAGTHDVRGYELQKVHTQLAKLGAQVLMISDSCHSGSAYRGVGEGNRMRTIMKDEARGSFSTRLGPQDDLFPQFALETPAPGQAKVTGSEPLPGFVFFSACGDKQSAYETEDEHGRPCGRLSLVLRHLLANLGEQTTYQELAEKVAAEFASRWPGSPQAPEFHSAAGKADELFFRGGFPPAHADIVPRSIHNGTLKLTMGDVMGVSQGAKFTFYKNLDDLAAHKNPIATGEATAVDPVTCDVQLDGGATVPPDAPAAMSTVSISEFSIATQGAIPDFIVAKLHELNDKHQLVLTDKPEKCSAVLCYDPVAKTINLYSPTAVPSDGQSAAEVPTLRPPIACRGPEDAEVVASNLLYAARIQRMMTLEHQDQDLLQVDLVIPGGSPRTVNGVDRLSENQRFLIRLTNKSDDSRLFVTLLTLDRTGDLQILYPPAGADPRPLEPGKHKDVTFNATIDDPVHLSAGQAEMSVLKVLATDQPMDLYPLAVPPQTGASNVSGTRGVGGQDDAVFDLMRDVLHGGELASQVSRGVPQAVISQQWATQNLIFGVESKDQK